MNHETILLRQVHPTFLQLGNMTSQVFCPTEKDKGLLSAYDNDLITAEGSWIHHTTVLGKKSSFVVGVTVQECQQMELPARPDPILVPIPTPSHSVIDFNGHAKSRWRTLSKKLQEFAEKRSKLFTPESG